MTTADTRMLDLPAGLLEVHREGAGHSLVLVPSLGRGQEDFDGIAPMLVAAGLRLIRPEPRGIGGSAPLREGATLFDMARDVIAAMEDDGVQTALVAGHAAGNWVARITAHLRPDLVRGVAMLAAVTGTTVEPAISAAIAGSFDTSLPDDVRLAHLRRAYFAPGGDASVWLAGWHTEVGARPAPRTRGDGGQILAARRRPQAAALPRRRAGRDRRAAGRGGAQGRPRTPGAARGGGWRRARAAARAAAAWPRR